MDGLKFGTSGLRGLVSELTDDVCAAYAIAFLKHMQGKHGIPRDGRLLVGYDLRSSSLRIAAACMTAARSIGMEVENCGLVPTPALALHAMSLGVPAIMVTGSHIPDDRNGLKFYRQDGEIDKSDEAGIVALLNTEATLLFEDRQISAVAADALRNYIDRCIGLLAPDAFRGLRIGAYQHSSVARDLMVEVLNAAGADSVALGRSDIFVPVDTEALRLEDIAFANEAAQKYKLAALISTDGDADRPLIADERGMFLRGDSLGILTAQFLGADAVVTPVTSNTAVELCGSFEKVYRTRVGSPYVIEGMAQAVKDGYKRVVGFEANGGVLLGTPVEIEGRNIAALPTRDAMLPILSVIGLAARAGSTVSKLLDDLPTRFTCSGRLEHVPGTVSAPFLQSLLDADTRTDFFSGAGAVREGDFIDGVRVVLSEGEVVHYRASGNAPELRCYTEASTDVRAAELLDWGLGRARQKLAGMNVPV